MKKVFVLFAVAASLVACNNSAENSTATDSSANAATQDTTTMSAPAPMADTTTHTSGDSTHAVTGDSSAAH